VTNKKDLKEIVVIIKGAKIKKRERDLRISVIIVDMNNLKVITTIPEEKVKTMTDVNEIT